MQIEAPTEQENEPNRGNYLKLHANRSPHYENYVNSRRINPPFLENYVKTREKNSADPVRIRRPFANRGAMQFESLWRFNFEQFWGLLARSLSGGIWRLILSNSVACSPNLSQDASGSSF